MIQKIIKTLVPKTIIQSHRNIRTDFSFKRSKKEGKLHVIADILKYNNTHNFIFPNLTSDPNISAALQFKAYAKKMRLNNVIKTPYFYPLDTSIVRVLPQEVSGIASLTQDYAKILTTDLLQVKNDLSKNSDDFSVSILHTIEAIDVVRQRAVEYYKNKDPRISGYMERIMSNIPASFDEALQKILFFNALMWWNKQQHIGLGRLDLVLMYYLNKDLNNGVITITNAKDKIKSFVEILGSHTVYKSVGLIGDTGQVILISGTDKEGNYVDNLLTRMFLEVIAELNIPDPKLIMRVCDKTSTELWQKAIECISKGNGSPLFANEAKIMNLMQEFGYNKQDVIDFGTSACWEPLIIGKSFDQNNCAENINLPLVVVKLMANKQKFKEYDDFELAFFNELEVEFARITTNAKNINFDRAPLQSLWMEGCVESLRDISQGGAKYNFHGFLCAGLPNAVNSLLNIKHLVFDRKEYTLEQLRSVLESNFVGSELVRERLINEPKKFGLPDGEVLDLSNRIMSRVSQIIEFTTINGTKAKIGFSSPGYLIYGEMTTATPDGRSASEPFATHISPVSKDIDFAEIIDFASQLSYSGNKINGNVVDFILSEQFVKNSDKFVQILRVAFNKGVYEMQLNVLNADQLIAAKANPELFPNLVVRVWGFSAYFADLPESYKDHLIERALNYKAS